MPVTSTSSAPYAPASAIIEIVSRYRSKGLSTPINGEVLGRAGISESLIPRTLYALKTLDLIDDDGAPTHVFEHLRRAPEGEYQRHMVEWLNGAYADVLKFVDPISADEIAIRDAFRNYKPFAQQPRMVSLFSGLYTAAGIREGKPSQPRQSRSRRGGTRVNAPAAGSVKRQEMDKKGLDSVGVGIKIEPPDVDKVHSKAGMPSMFERELLGKFPVFDPAWPDDIKTQWFAAFQQFLAMTKPSSGKE